VKDWVEQEGTARQDDGGSGGPGGGDYVVSVPKMHILAILLYNNICT
jgi:hypothetical protein